KIAPLLKNEGIPFRALSEEDSSNDQKLLMLDSTFLNRPDPSLFREAAGILFLLEKEPDQAQLDLPSDVIFDYCVGEVSHHKLRSLLQSIRMRQQIQRIRGERDTHLRRLKELNNIGIALSTERDPVRLLNMILSKSREITSADAGSLYLVE